jgi:hypothetical protein
MEIIVQKLLFLPVVLHRCEIWSFTEILLSSRKNIAEKDVWEDKGGKK